MTSATMDSTTSTAAVIDEVIAVFAECGAGAYFGESVSMTEHALQAAYFAASEGAAGSLIIAALLHDVGHLVEPVPAHIGDWVLDARHEEIGSRWLEQRFTAEVFEPGAPARTCETLSMRHRQRVPEPVEPCVGHHPEAARWPDVGRGDNSF